MIFKNKLMVLQIKEFQLLLSLLHQHFWQDQNQQFLNLNFNQVRYYQVLNLDELYL